MKYVFPLSLLTLKGQKQLQAIDKTELRRLALYAIKKPVELNKFSCKTMHSCQSVAILEFIGNSITLAASEMMSVGQSDKETTQNDIHVGAQMSPNVVDRNQSWKGV